MLLAEAARAALSSIQGIDENADIKHLHFKHEKRGGCPIVSKPKNGGLCKVVQGGYRKSSQFLGSPGVAYKEIFSTKEFRLEKCIVIWGDTVSFDFSTNREVLGGGCEITVVWNRKIRNNLAESFNTPIGKRMCRVANYIHVDRQSVFFNQELKFPLDDPTPDQLNQGVLTSVKLPAGRVLKRVSLDVENPLSYVNPTIVDIALSKYCQYS